MRREVLTLREPEIRALLDPRSCISAMEQAFAAYSTGRAQLPAVIHLDIPEDEAPGNAAPQNRGEIHVKAGYLNGGPYYAVKIVSGFPNNPQLGLPANDGMIVVFDARTDFRTGAAGAVAARHLARAKISSVAVIGTGAQARYQLEMLALERTFSEVRIWGRDRDKACACADDLAKRRHEESTSKAAGEGARPTRSVKGGARVPACIFAATESVREAVDGADLVITVTASREPLVRAAWLKPGVTVIAVGSDGPDKQELDVDVLARSDKIVADSIPQCLRLGEIHHAVERGAISKDKIYAELGEITAGLKPGRVSESEIIVCDLTGVGVQDVAAASLVMERAKAERVL
jgi:ornithine cyclodeaminase/alanine dehydrogenase-like protein (mu-crystallin family)